MKSINLMLMGILLMSSLVLATQDLSLNYNAQTGAIINGSCNNIVVEVGLQAFLGENLVWVDQVRSTNYKFTATFIPVVEGSYTLLAACDGEKAVQEIFCIGNCSEESVIEDEGTPIVPDGTPQTPADVNQGSSGNGRGSSCRTAWDCGTWTYCNAQLKQTRVCTDLNYCKSSRTEQRACTKCEESWICSAWSDCVSEEQVRACQDEHKCGTTVLKPNLRKLCQATYVSGPAPAYTSPVIPAPTYYSASQPEPVYTPPVVAPKLLPKATASFSFAKVWQDYQVLFLGLGIVIVLIIIVIILVAHFAKPKQKVYNLDELKEWIQKERQMGTNDAQVRQILAQNTGWSEEEIGQAFVELRGPG